MSHQPFETWILDEEPLTAEDRRSLYAHLESCAQCQRLSNKWQTVRQELRARPIAVPAPGFRQRWQASLVERRAREQRKQAWKIFGFFSAGALLVLMMMAAYLAATTSPTDWMSSFIRLFSSSKSLINLVLYAVQTWLSATPPAVNLVLWIYLTLSLCLLTLVWVLILWRTRIVGVLNNEENSQTL